MTEPLGFRPHLDGYYDAALDLQRHVERRSEALFARWEARKDALATATDVTAWQQRLRERTLAALGGLPPDGTPLSPEQVGTTPGDGCSVERVIFQSLPEVYVTANLYLPRHLEERTGAVLFLCGHAHDAKTHYTYQAVCQRLARNGLIALAIDPIGQGERKSYLDADGRELVRWGTVEHTYAGYGPWWLGQSIARYFVHDARRALDYLAGRPEVDPTRLGVTGSSGGGTQAALLMLLEPRLAAAAPATFITRRREYMWTSQSQDAEQVLPGGSAAGLDHEDSLIAMAPRPVAVLAVDYDFFAIEGTLATVERARRIYRLLGAADRLELARARSTHEYHPELARAVTSFFARHLAGRDPAELDEAEPRPLDPAALRCTRSSQMLLDRPQARRVFDLTLAEYRSRAAAPADPAARAERAHACLRAAVVKDRRPLPEFFPRWLPGPALAGARVLHGFWRPEAEALSAGVLARPADGRFDRLVVALFDHGTTELEARRDWLGRRLAAGQAVLALDVRGSGALAPRDLNPHTGELHGTRYKLMTDLLWLGDSLAAMQVYDVVRALAFARADPEVDLAARPLELFGAGRGAYRASLAAALDPEVACVELEGPSPDVTACVTERLYGEGAVDLETLPEYLLPGLLRELDWADVGLLTAARSVSSVSGGTGRRDDKLGGRAGT